MTKTAAVIYVAKDDDLKTRYCNGERNLMAAIISRAISDLQNLKHIDSYRESFRPHIERWGTQARSWFLGIKYGGEGRTPVTFDSAVTALDLDKKTILSHLRKLGLLSD